MIADTPHSRLGKASFWTGVATFVVFLVAIGFGLNRVYAKHGGGPMSPEGIILNITFLLVFAVNLVGVGLGIAGLCEKPARKVFSVLGVVTNLLPVAIFFGAFLFALVFR